ncbi:MAG: phosphate ABC transporter permease subunit PstC [Planctomycetes bacterium]|nr:phosphate ABC transporter permease subunit PstC [Planctomycetota bacterium]
MLLSKRASRSRRLAGLAGHVVLLSITASSALAVLFIFYFIARDALPFFQLRGWREFVTGLEWYPADDPPSFGAFPIFLGSGLVTLGAILVAVPLGITAAVCLSDILPFGVRQVVKPVVEVLAAIPSVAYGFFALVIFAPLMQDHGGRFLAVIWWCVATPPLAVAVFVTSALIASRFPTATAQAAGRWISVLVLAAAALTLLTLIGLRCASVEILSGTNALNVSIILGVMALPTVISVSEDALQAVGRELREGAYALGATRAETLLRVVIPAATSGLCAAVILGIMRAIGETMVVWMASGNAAQVPKPWFNLLEPVRTLTATIAGDMGEADHVTGSARYHVLFAMALALLVIAFVCNLVSERVIARSALKNR